ncbi:MAG: restriction endonuclease subunit S, partial [Synergistaceae bacterium]|nr:restriction endonuclease subunit S [Synergistaceae bacterium]
MTGQIAKGSEGIKMIAPGGKLYNDKDRAADDTLAAAVRKSFNNCNFVLSESQSEYAKIVNTRYMLDFSRANFNKAIRLNVEDSIRELWVKYELIKLDDIFKVIESGSRPQGGVEHYTSGALSLGGEHIDNTSGYINLSSPKYVPLDFYENAKVGKIRKGDILLCKDGARTGKVAIVRGELGQQPAMINEHVFLLRANNDITQYYMFQILFSEQGQYLLKQYITGAAQGGLNSSNLKQIKLPV